MEQEQQRIDDLQTLCAAALRRLYVSETEDGGNRSASSTLSAVEALSECAKLEDNPFLQCEAAWALLASVVDRLAAEPEQGSVAIAAHQTLFKLRGSSLPAVRKSARVALSWIFNRESAYLEDIARVVMTSDTAGHGVVTATAQLAALLALDKDPPIQRIIACGVVPRFVEFLRRDDEPELQLRAARALTCIVLSTPEQADVVLADVDSIPSLIRLLHSPSDKVKVDVAECLSRVASKSSEYRDLLLQSQIMQPLLVQLRQPQATKTMRRLSRTLCSLYKDKPVPEWAMVRPALPCLARLLVSPDEKLVYHACRALSRITMASPGDHTQAVVEAGMCRRLVELLQHPSPRIHCLALRTAISVAAGGGQQKQAILDLRPRFPLRSLLLSSPQAEARAWACWAICTVFAGNREEIQDGIDQDVFPLIVQCLADAARCVSHVAVRVVTSVTCNGTPQQTQFLVQLGCIPPLCDLLSADGGASEAVRHTFVALAKILRAGEDLAVAGAANPMAELVLEAGGASQLEGLRRGTDDVAVREGAARLLQTYFGGPATGGGKRGAAASLAAGVDGESGDGGENEPPQRRARTS